jgi:hypothetical protein|nr:MAG TPA: putative membrane protein [Caudoviricetes sp.]
MENKHQRQQWQRPKAIPQPKEAQPPINLNEVLQSVEPEKRDIIIRAIWAIEERKAYSGPLPAPEDFGAYKEVLSDAPERILAMVEKQIEHRINMEKEIVSSGLSESKKGQYFGAFIVLVCILSSVFLGMNGHDFLAGTLVAITATVGTIFVLKKAPHSGDKEIPLKGEDIEE